MARTAFTRAAQPKGAQPRLPSGKPTYHGNRLAR